MGLFDIFMSEDKRIARSVRKLTNRDSQPEDREAAAKWLAEKGTPEALVGLLARFDLQLDHQLKDAGEKEFVYSLLLDMGAKAVEPTQSWLRACKSVGLPMQLLADLSGEGSAIEAACELLAAELERDDFKPHKKKALLIWLTERRDERCAPAAIPFLRDFDEGVRYAAAEVIYGQPGDAGRDELWQAFVHPEEESNRFRVRIAEGFIAKRWPAGDVPDGIELPGGIAVMDGRLVKR